MYTDVGRGYSRLSSGITSAVSKFGIFASKYLYEGGDSRLEACELYQYHIKRTSDGQYTKAASTTILHQIKTINR